MREILEIEAQLLHHFLYTIMLCCLLWQQSCFDSFTILITLHTIPASNYTFINKIKLVATRLHNRHRIEENKLRDCLCKFKLVGVFRLQRIAEMQVVSLQFRGLATHRT